MPVMQIKDLLFRRRYGKLYLKYEFNVKEIPNTLRACLILEIYVCKGKWMEVVLSDEWFLDRSFLTADILSL